MASLGTLVVNLNANTDHFRRRMKQSTGDLQSMKYEALAVATAITAAFAYSAKTVAEYDDAIRSVAAVTGATGAAFDSMNAKAKELGASTSFTAVQVASLMTELGRAGFIPEQINEMTASVLDLSRATGTEAAEAAGIMAATMRQFGLEAGESTRVADVLTATANKTFNTVTQLGEAFSYIGPVMKQLKIPLEDAAAALGILGNVGIQGSSAGTAFKRFALLTSAEAEKLESIFGVSFQGAGGSVLGLMDTLDRLQSSLSSMDDQTAIKSLNDAFGLLGITGAASLAAAGDGVKELRDELLQASGIANKTAKEMDAGLGGALRILGSGFEALKIRAGELLSGALIPMTNAMTTVVGVSTDYAKVLVPIASGVLAVAAAVLVYVAALKAYAIATRIALALSGPKGWVILGAGIAVAGAAAMAMSDDISSLSEATAKATQASKAHTESLHQEAKAANSAAVAMANRARAGGAAQAVTEQLKDKLQSLESEPSRVKRIVAEFLELSKASNLMQHVAVNMSEQLRGAESGLTGMVSKLREEISILKGEATETGIVLANMASAGHSQQEIEELRRLMEEKRKLEEAAKPVDTTMSDNAAAIKQSLKTPEQLLNDTLSEVMKLVDANLLSMSEAMAFVSKRESELMPDSASVAQKASEPQFAGAMQRGSAEAFKTILSASRKSPELTESMKQTKLLQTIANQDKKNAQPKVAPEFA